LLEEFVQEHRAAIIARAKQRIAARVAPIATRAELEEGVSYFLDDLLAALAGDSRPSARSALQNGFTVAQVVYDFGDVCQAITSEITERDAVIGAREFRILNQCLDDAIASAVTAFAQRQRRTDADRQTQQLTAFADQLRPLLASALLAFEMVQRGAVGASGSTGALVGRSLRALRREIDGAVALARLDRGAAANQPISLAVLLEDLEVPAAIDAKGRGVRLAVERGDGITILGDREIVASALTSLLEIAIQATNRHGLVDVKVTQADPTVTISVGGGTSPDSGDGAAIAFAERAIGSCGGSVDVHLAPDARTFRVVVPRASAAD